VLVLDTHDSINGKMMFSSLYLCQWPHGWPHGELVRAAYLAPLRTLWRSGRPEAASIFDLRPNPYNELSGACESLSLSSRGVMTWPNVQAGKEPSQKKFLGGRTQNSTT
jgi:hypothetical protein